MSDKNSILFFSLLLFIIKRRPFYDYVFVYQVMLDHMKIEFDYYSQDH